MGNGQWWLWVVFCSTCSFLVPLSFDTGVDAAEREEKYWLGKLDACQS